jgi:hypothetical protein
MAGSGAPVEVPYDAWSQTVITAWNLMDARIDYSALPVVAELVGCADMESLIHGLLTLRETVRRQA